MSGEGPWDGGGLPGGQARHPLFPCRFGDDIPGMEGLGTGMGIPPPLAARGQGLGGVTLPQPLSSLSSDITVICPWEAFSHLELHELAQYGII